MRSRESEQREWEHENIGCREEERPTDKDRDRDGDTETARTRRASGDAYVEVQQQVLELEVTMDQEARVHELQHSDQLRDPHTHNVLGEPAATHAPRRHTVRAALCERHLRSGWRKAKSNRSPAGTKSITKFHVRCVWKAYCRWTMYGCSHNSCSVARSPSTHCTRPHAVPLRTVVA